MRRLAAIAALLLGAVPAAAAVWVPVRFVADGPERPLAIVAQRWQAPTFAWQPLALWQAPSVAQGGLTAPSPGSIDTAWVSVSESPAMWRAGGMALRLAAVSAAGDTGAWSNLQLVATGAPRDTLLFDACGWTWLTAPGALPGAARGWQLTAPVPTKATIYAAVWVRAPGDTVLTAPPLIPELAGKGPIVHAEDLVLALRCRLCASYGYVALRGVADSTVCDSSQVCR